MSWLNVILLAVAFISFGFYSFQKGRGYERGLYKLNQDNKDTKNTKSTKSKK